jgi:hypothetical protein
MASTCGGGHVKNDAHYDIAVPAPDIGRPTVNRRIIWLWRFARTACGLKKAESVLGININRKG